jgi:hypothetical protein
MEMLMSRRRKYLAGLAFRSTLQILPFRSTNRKSQRVVVQSIRGVCVVFDSTFTRIFLRVVMGKMIWETRDLALFELREDNAVDSPDLNF